MVRYSLTCEILKGSFQPPDSRKIQKVPVMEGDIHFWEKKKTVSCAEEGYLYGVRV